ncbi:hypothetical protein ACKWTF_011171 [Chironomus riparius]
MLILMCMLFKHTRIKEFFFFVICLFCYMPAAATHVIHIKFTLTLHTHRTLSRIIFIFLPFSRIFDAEYLKKEGKMFFFVILLCVGTGRKVWFGGWKLKRLFFVSYAVILNIFKFKKTCDFRSLNSSIGGHENNIMDLTHY